MASSGCVAVAIAPLLFRWWYVFLVTSRARVPSTAPTLSGSRGKPGRYTWPGIRGAGNTPERRLYCLRLCGWLLLCRRRPLRAHVCNYAFVRVCRDLKGGRRTCTLLGMPLKRSSSSSLKAWKETPGNGKGGGREGKEGDGRDKRAIQQRGGQQELIPVGLGQECGKVETSRVGLEAVQQKEGGKQRWRDRQAGRENKNDRDHET